MKIWAPRILLIVLVLAGAAIIIFKPGEKKVELTPPVDEIKTETTSTTEAVAQNEIPAAKTANQVEISAGGAYLLETNEPLYVFKNGKRWPIASITKLMTSFAARRLFTGEEIITMDEASVGAPGEAGNFKAGEKFRAADLVDAMLVASSNDAAEALAADYGKEAFVAEMNGFAAGIGMTNTVFVDPTGLSAGNLSTADDLSKLVRFIWGGDPEIFSITRKTQVNIIDIDGVESRKLLSTNAFAGRSNFLGGKTGQIPDSNGNLVSIFRVADKSSPVIIVVLGAKDRFQETEKILMKL